MRVGRRRISKTRAALGLLLLPAILWLLYLVESRQVDTYVITSESMAPALKTGEVWLVAPIRTVDVGDVVVFHHPFNFETLVVKRVVALEGDRVEVIGGRLFVNRKPSPPPHGHDGLVDLSDRGWVLGPGEVFVVGDNRAYSVDSRDYGPVDREAVIGELTRRLRVAENEFLATDEHR